MGAVCPRGSRSAFMLAEAGVWRVAEPALVSTASGRAGGRELWLVARVDLVVAPRNPP